jgi:hypothetical protein
MVMGFGQISMPLAIVIGEGTTISYRLLKRIELIFSEWERYLLRPEPRVTFVDISASDFFEKWFRLRAKSLTAF